MIKTFLFISDRDDQKVACLILDNDFIYCYVIEGCVKINKYQKLDGNTIFIGTYPHLWCHKKLSINHRVKCGFTYNNETYLPDTLRTKKRFLSYLNIY